MRRLERLMLLTWLSHHQSRLELLISKHQPSPPLKTLISSSKPTRSLIEKGTFFVNDLFVWMFVCLYQSLSNINSKIKIIDKIVTKQFHVITWELKPYQHLIRLFPLLKEKIQPIRLSFIPAVLLADLARTTP